MIDVGGDGSGDGGQKTAVLPPPSCKGHAEVFHDALAIINEHNLHHASKRAVGVARNGRGGFGTMHANGMRVHKDRVTTSPCAANSLVPEATLLKFVESLGIIGRHCFPDVIAVIQAMKADCDLRLPNAMGGVGQFYRVEYSLL